MRGSPTSRWLPLFISLLGIKIKDPILKGMFFVTRQPRVCFHTACPVLASPAGYKPRRKLNVACETLLLSGGNARSWICKMPQKPSPVFGASRMWKFFD